MSSARNQQFWEHAAAASILLVASACTTSQTINHPPIDASKTAMTEALIVDTDYKSGFVAPSNIIRGAGKGAVNAMGVYVGGIGQSGGGDGALLGILLLPIALPISAGIGAALAHSAEEVDAARASFRELGQDEELLASLEERFIQALGTQAKGSWACIAARGENDQPPCQAQQTIATIKLRPVFSVTGKGKYDPDIHFAGTVMAVATVEQVASDQKPERVFEAKWAYRDELGEFFELAENDAELMRSKVSEILDRFATRIAQDIYTAPRPEVVIQKREHNGRTFFDFPERTVVRIEQGSDLFSRATHAMIWPFIKPFGKHCWIEAVDGNPTGHNEMTSPASRGLPTLAGSVKLDVICSKNAGSINESRERFAIEISAQPGVVYQTDGQTYKQWSFPSSS